jgi:hypothetical protein
MEAFSGFLEALFLRQSVTRGGITGSWLRRGVLIVKPRMRMTPVKSLVPKITHGSLAWHTEGEDPGADLILYLSLKQEPPQ